MIKEKLQKIQSSLSDKMTKDQLLEIINELMEDNIVQMDTIAQMQGEIDGLEYELECYQAEILILGY